MLCSFIQVNPGVSESDIYIPWQLFRTCSPGRWRGFSGIFQPLKITVPPHRSAQVETWKESTFAGTSSNANHGHGWPASANRLPCLFFLFLVEKNLDLRAYILGRLLFIRRPMPTWAPNCIVCSKSRKVLFGNIGYNKNVGHSRAGKNNEQHFISFVMLIRQLESQS